MKPNDRNRDDPEPVADAAGLKDESPLESLGEAISESVLGADDGKPAPAAKPEPQDVTDQPGKPGKPGEGRQPR